MSHGPQLLGKNIFLTTLLILVKPMTPLISIGKSLRKTTKKFGQISVAKLLNLSSKHTHSDLQTIIFRMSIVDNYLNDKLFVIGEHNMSRMFNHGNQPVTPLQRKYAEAILSIKQM